MGYIYKITNQVNGKVYIGQTVRTVNERWKEHLKYGKSKNKYGHNKHLYNSIHLYGEKSFCIETIEECDDDFLSEREQFWISYYNSCDENFGYNLTKGGEGGKLLDYNQIYSLWDDGLSSGEIANTIGASQSNIVRILKTYKNYSVEKGLSRGANRVKKNKSKPVSQYDRNGNFINSFCSAYDAAKSIDGGNPSTISKCCRNKTGLSCGFQWRFSDDIPPGEYPRHSGEPRSINQYDLEGNFIRKFNSIAEASRATLIDTSSIIKCCQYKQQYAKGYKWAYTS